MDCQRTVIFLVVLNMGRRKVIVPRNHRLGRGITGAAQKALELDTPEGAIGAKPPLCQCRQCQFAPGGSILRASPTQCASAYPTPPPAMVDSVRMLSLDDNRWNNLTGGYRMKCDPRPLLVQLESEQTRETAWNELWEELHHQGDVGEASYASVPHLVKIHQKGGQDASNTFTIVAIIELARGKGTNPEVPKWLEEDYLWAIRELAETGTAEIWRTDEPETVRAILSVIAIAKDLRTHGRFFVEYSEDELLDIESRD
jgi:hypothetical protein